MLKLKNIITILLFCATALSLKAQQYGNEWINYNQFYYKFALVKDSVYRLSLSQLFAAGLPATVQGDNLQIFHDGVEIPIYVSQSSTLNTNDYIDFYGEKAKGNLDARLYKNPNLQLNPNLNLVSDTSFYFVTFNSSTANKRFAPRANIISNPPLKEDYFWDRIRIDYRSEFVTGFSDPIGGQSIGSTYYNLNSSQYEEEGYVRKTTTNVDSISLNCSNPFKVAGGPFGVLKTTVVGKSFITSHRIKLHANGTEIADSSFSSFDFRKFNIAIPMTSLTATNKMNIRYTPLNGTPAVIDRYGVSFIDFYYPRLFNFNNQKSFLFELNPKIGDYYIEINNFDYGSVAPRLFDLSANEFIDGDISVAGQVRFLIPGSNSAKKYVLQNVASSANMGSVESIYPVTFKNYSLATNQGDYIMLSHPKLINTGTGNDYLGDYKTYRSSLNGGGFKSIIVSADDVYNEFGYGYSFSTLGIKNFLHFAHANAQWQDKPKHVYLIGKGIDYGDYVSVMTANQSAPGTYPFYPIPSFGQPCSDLLFTDFGKNSIPQISLGRLPAFNETDIKVYLEKVKDHEATLRNTTQTTAEKAWQKRILHIAGGKDGSDQAPIVNTLLLQESIIKKPNYGGDVTLIKKSSTASIDYVNSATIDNLINSGVSIIQFFGHSSANDIDYNLGDPATKYSNFKKFPVFIANGCNAGNMFSKNANKYLSEKWVLTPNVGAIAFIASVNTGYTSPLGNYTDSLYKYIATASYGKTIGEIMKDNIQGLMTNGSYSNNFLFRMHAEQIQLDGDPAVPMYAFPKPDYAVENKDVFFKQFNITTTLDSVDVDIVLHNLGRYTNDSLEMSIKRITPAGVSYTLLNKKIPAFANTQSVSLRFPTLGNLGLGANKLEIALDQNSFVDEVSELNNTILFPFNIFNDDLVPVYPYDFSIVSEQGLEFKSSTLDVFSGTKTYAIQLDTSDLFNSPFLVTKRIISSGGVIKWQPTFTMTDSTVYYWRTAMDTLYGNKKHRWTSSSFIYLPQSLPGWNQSHHYQFLKNKLSNVNIDSSSRKFNFTTSSNTISVTAPCLYGAQPFTYKYDDYYAKINGADLFTHGCDLFPLMQSLQFIVLDTASGLPWINVPVSASPSASGRYGSIRPCRGSLNGVSADPFFEFPFDNLANRNKIMAFIDSIPQGTYVVMQARLSCAGYQGSISNKVFVSDWMKDTLVNGSNSSLYHKLFNIGFTQIDSFTKNRPMIFFQQKNMPASTIQHIGLDSTIKLQADFNFKATENEGTIVSDKIGPAKTWGSYIKYGKSVDSMASDSVSVDIFGINNAGVETFIAKIVGDTSLAFIDALQYPFLKLKMNTKDDVFQTPEQLKKWRVHFQPVPEAALNPNAAYSFADTLSQGQIRRFTVAIENLTKIPMDSMLVSYRLIDSKNTPYLLGTQRYRPLASHDTLIANFNVNTRNYSGAYTFEVEANPENDQLEQYHPNNLGLKNVYIIPDNLNPMIDVTFDGIHILDKDIVSAKPFISIVLKDENKYLALDDTSLVKVYLKYPGDNFTQYQIPFDGTQLKFIPAVLNGTNKNQARVEFRPTFIKDGNDYVLIVEAKDKTDNGAGSNNYKVGFTIANKPSISSMLNYPNPFTTATQFMFTVTGSEVPTYMKIQVLSPTGRIVREITKAELGPIHIGRNITEFKWNGDDQFGKPLANGVYLYRFISNLNDEKIEHLGSGADKWTKKGFGKLYIMR
jgi:hypothetical protein